jgi:hypothetical protein
MVCVKVFGRFGSLLRAGAPLENANNRDLQHSLATPLRLKYHGSIDLFLAKGLTVTNSTVLVTTPLRLKQIMDPSTCLLQVELAQTTYY